MFINISHWIVWVLYMTLLIVTSTAQQDADISRKQVLGTLLNTTIYDASIAPDFDQDVPTTVTIQLIIHDMYSVSETAMEYSVDVYLRMWWRDERLDYSNISNCSKPKLEIDSKNIGNVWQPDVFFQNEKRANVHSVTTPNKLMHIHRNGTVVYSTRLAMTLGCTMHLQFYPFDKQRCPVYIQSYGYTLENIKLQWDTVRPIKIEPELEMPQFDLEPGVMTSDYQEEVSNTGTFSTLKVELDLSRSVGYYFVQVFIPSILLVFLSWVSFWVDPKAIPARVSLGVTCVLSMTTQSSGIRQSLPPVSYVKAIDVWMCVCLMFVFAALLEFAYVNVLMRRPSTKYEDDSKTCPEDDAGKTTHGDNIEESPQKKRDNKTWFERLKGHLFPTINDNLSKAYRVDNISRIVFPGTFILFLVLFLVVCYSARSLALSD